MPTGEPLSARKPVKRIKIRPVNQIGILGTRGLIFDTPAEHDDNLCRPLLRNSLLLSN